MFYDLDSIYAIHISCRDERDRKAHHISYMNVDM
jgi:hypothetical protein